ncbi:MAG: hypothetical protein ABEH77_07165 [Halobacteriaceae archaeon]
MDEAYVQLLCPDCEKHWEASPGDLPGPRAAFSCPDCGTERRLSEFMRTERDLETLKRLS